MASVVSFVRLSCLFFIFFVLNTSILCFKDDDSISFFSPYLNRDFVSLQLQPDDGSEVSSEFKSKAVYYHLQKRSTETTSPVKKAIQNEKKIPIKGLPASITDVTMKKMVNEVKSMMENASDVAEVPNENVTFTTQVAQVIAEKYNTSSASTSTTTATSTSPASSSTTVNLISSTTSTTTTSIPLIESVPTRPSNITNTTVDYHVYYNSTVFLEEDKAMTFWLDFESLPKNQTIMHHMLSHSHRRAATVTLSFDFPFYGHPLRNITIATGGFLFMGDYMHSWLAATQYVAPLMANFDTSLSNDSTVRYYDNGTAFVIEWNEVSLQDEKQGGNFTFQATLLENGNIIFVYQTIPVSVTEIGDESHPVKVGLSDAYVIERVIYFIRRKTIYEYHRVNMKKEEIGNHTAIYFTALETCLNFKDCDSCMNSEIGLECVWCESAKRCSDGLDRHRQSWLQQGCDTEKSSINCKLLPSGNKNPLVQPYTEYPPKPYAIRTPSDDHANHIHPAGPLSPFHPIHEDDEVVSHRLKGNKVGEEQGVLGVGGVVAILLILGIMLGAVTWVGYAYRNPHTSSGQLLIRYRPTQWRFRSGEARYTAASVHM